MKFKDREEAGRRLAERLTSFKGRDAVVLGLPRGGVVTARPIAQALGVPLDVLVARKIGAPNQPEFAIGAVTARGTRVLNMPVLRRYLLPPDYLEQETAAQRLEAERREAMFRGDRPMAAITGKIAILVDDGIATGMTMFAAIEDARAANPSAIIVAVPVAPKDTYQQLTERVEKVVVLDLPDPFVAVGLFYEDFTQTTDEEVQRLLAAKV